jgi:hypothetical protein
VTVTQAQLERALTTLDQVMASVNIGRGSTKRYRSQA